MQAQINALSERLEDCKTEVGQQLELGNARMGNLDTSIKDALDTILELFNSFEGFFKVIGKVIGKDTVKHFFGVDI